MKKTVKIILGVVLLLLGVLFVAAASDDSEDYYRDAPCIYDGYNQYGYDSFGGYDPYHDMGH